MTDRNMSESTDGNKQKKTAEPLSATWKFDLIQTANRDPDLSPSALKVLCAYLNFCNRKNPTPYIAMPVLMAETNLSEPTIKKARQALVASKYLTRMGRSFGGAYRYELANERQEVVAKVFAEARDANIQKYQNLPPIRDGKNPGAKVSKFTPNGRDQNLPPNTGKPLIGSAAQADAALNNNLSHQLKDEENSSSTAFSRLDAEKAEAVEEVENRSSPVHPIDAPQVGEPFVGETDPSEVDDFDIRPSMPDLDTAPSPDQFESEPGSIVEADTDAGTPRDPDALTGDRRENEPESATPDPVGAWLRENAYLVANARKQSPIAVAKAWALTVARETGFSAETSRTMLSAALQQAIGDGDDDDAGFIHPDDEMLDADQNLAIGF